MKNTVFYLEGLYDTNMFPKNDMLEFIELNHSRFGTISGYDEGKLADYDRIYFHYRNQPGTFLESSSITSIESSGDELIIVTQNSVYVFRKTKSARETR